MSFLIKIRNMFNNRPVLSILVVFIFIIVMTLLLLGNKLLIALGEYLVVEDSLSDSQYIVVLQGGTPDRIVHGAELHQQGYADNILMVESHSFTNYELMEKHDLDLPSGVEINKQAAVQMNVDKEEIIIIPAKVDSTSQEAEKIAHYLRNNYPDDSEGHSIILVTSKFHSSRAQYIFERELENHNLNQIEVISSPSPYDPYNPSEWWKDRRQARHTFMEYLKFINTITFDF